MIFIRFISKLPFPVLYALSDFLFILTYYLVGYRKKLVRNNLANSFPEKSKNELRQIERTYYRNLCDYAVETIKLITISAEELRQRMRYTNPEMVFEYSKKHQSVLLLSSHQFNWEWLLVSGELSLNVPVDFVYQPLKNAFVDTLMQTCRTRFGGYAIKRNEVAREFVKRKNITRGIAIVADQYPGKQRHKKYETQFLNQETVFYYGSQQMAFLTQCPALFAVVERVSRGYYTCTLINVGEPPYDKDSETVIEAYVHAVEKVIRQHPDGWLWSHNRWKSRHLQNNP
jgi:Kdo2-lipid IVA lauroyltransferase/acyltransferase